MEELKKTIELPDPGKQLKSLIAAHLGAVNQFYDWEQAKQFKDVLSYISNPERSLELLELDESDLRSRLRGILHKQASRTGKKIAPATIKQWQGKLDSIINRVNDTNRALKKAGWDVQKIKAVEKYMTASADLNISDLATLSSFTEESDHFLQPLFSRVRALKIGSFGNSISSSMPNQDILMKGGHVSVFTSRGPVTLGYGRNEDLGLAKDAGIENSVYSSPQKLAYLSVGIYNSDYLKGKFTWVNSVSSGQLNERLNVSALPKSTVGLTLSQTLNMNKVGKLNLDLSKSASIYRNALEPGAERVLEQRNFFNDYLFDSSFQTLAVGISHQGEIQPWQMSDNFYLNYSGLGYQSPVVTGISPVRLKFGGNLKKRFFNNKLTFNLRTDFRNTPIGSVSGDRWKNHHFQIDGRFRVSRKYNLSLKYTESGMIRRTGNLNSTLYSSDKFQVDANANYKISKYHSSSHLNVAYQNLNNMQMQSSPGSFVNMTYSHSMVLGQSSLTANMFYNKEISPDKLIGDMVNGEISYQYVFIDKWNLSTGVNYLENDKISKQYGVRQSVQLMAAGNFDFNATADIRKNLIEPVYPDLYPACRAELSLKYYLNR